MQKKYVVRLSEEERCALREVMKKLKGSSQKVRRAQILLKADIEGPNWTDERIAEAFGCQTKAVENIRRRVGEQEARIIAMRSGAPPKGYANWSLRLLSRKVVELGIANTVSHKTVRRTLKKMG